MVMLGRSKSVTVIFWISFVTLRTYWKSFLLKNFTMTRPFLPTRWHASMSFAGISISTFSKILENIFSKSLAGKLWGILATSMHSCLQYWALAQHCLSMLTSRSDNSWLMFLDRASTPSDFFTHSFNSLTLSFTSCWIDSFFSWRFIGNAVSSGFVSSLSYSSDNLAMVKNSFQVII